jgi:hypothetical protein
MNWSFFVLSNSSFIIILPFLTGRSRAHDFNSNCMVQLPEKFRYRARRFATIITKATNESYKSRDSSFGITTRLRAGRSGFWGSISGGDWEFFLHHRVQNGSGARPDSYPMGTRGSSPRGKAAGA